ncbi:hypothetical protein CJ014_00460 [Pleomorphomonas carboxyditropha]|uniref:AsmA domain-containing protein n=1 Tax=Pleomorphomonas carboxyditropha TaxID=2023338 RepID=A0A2G9X221_9HYPH|nr:hypothetical protein CJ014_00460 [Pleomorphomonas carboxyditropha]
MALVGPLFVDWTAYRAAFETEAAHVLGHKVSVRGTADASLLPYPSLSFSDVVIGDDPNAPLMTVGRFNMEIELFPLLSGEIHVTEMQVVQPELNVRIDDDGAFEWMAAEGGIGINPSRVMLSGVDIEDGRLVVSDARHSRPVVVDGIEARLDAPALAGPYKVEGTARAGGDTFTIKAATGAASGNGAFALKANVRSAVHPVVANFDGQLKIANHRPTWAGKATLDRLIAKEDQATLPWSLAADLDVSNRAVLAKALEFRYGAEERPFTISGAATLDLAAVPSFEAVLSARQIDLDRTLGEGPDKPVSFDGALAAFGATIAGLPVPSVPGRIGFDIPGVVVGGNIVSDLRADLVTAASGWTIDTLEATLPGKSSLTARGALATAPTVGFNGDVTLASDQPATLIAWWAPDRPKLGLDPFRLSAKVTASADGLALQDVDARLDEGRVSGSLDFSPGVAGRKPRLTLSLDADQLRLSDVQTVAGLATGQGAGADVVVKAAIGSLIAGDARAEGFDVSASLVDSTLDVDRLFVRSLSGARVTAAGTIRDVTTTPDGSIQMRVSAEKLDGIADLARALVPDTPAAAFLRDAAPHLGPASLEGTVQARASGEGTDIRVDLNGSAASTNIRGELAFKGRIDAWDAADISTDVSLTGPDGAELMRQFGLAVPEVGRPGAGSLTLSAMGKSKDGLAVVLRGAMGPTEVTLNGSATLTRGAAPSAELDLDLKSPDVGSLLVLTGNIVQGVIGSTPADVAAHLSIGNRKVLVNRIEGKLDEVPTAGDIAIDFAPNVPKVTGSLSFDEGSLAGLGEAILGPAVFDFPIVQSRNPWPEAPFGAALIDGFDTDLALKFDRLDIEGGPPAKGVSLSLASNASGTGLDGISATLAGGKLSGDLMIKRDLDGTAGVSGTLRLDGAAAEEFAWRRDDRPMVTGAFSIDTQINATGRTLAGWMSSLTGGGSFSVQKGRLAHMTTRAFDQVIRLADAGKELSEDRIRQAFTDNVDMGDLAFDRLDAAFTLAGGTFRAPNIVVSGKDGATTGSATVDIARATVDSEWRLSLDAGDAAAAGGVPQVSVLFKGPVANPSRRIDVTAFASYLGIRALEKETQRVLTMQADILERELLSRQVLRDREALDRRNRLMLEARERAAAAALAEKAKAAALLAAQKARAEKTADPLDAIGKILEDGAAPARPGAKLKELPSSDVGLPPGGVTETAP